MRRLLLLAAFTLLLIKTSRSSEEEHELGQLAAPFGTELPLLPPFDSTTDGDALGRFWPLSWSVEVARYGVERSLSLSIDPAFHELSAFEQVREQVAFQLARLFFPEDALEDDVDRATDRAVARWLDLKVCLRCFHTLLPRAPPRTRPPPHHHLLPTLPTPPTSPLKRVEWSTRMMVRGAEISLFLAEDPANNLAEHVILKDVMNLRGSLARPFHALELGAFEGATSSWIAEFLVSRRAPTKSIRPECTARTRDSVHLQLVPRPPYPSYPPQAGQPPQLVPPVH